jgi:hypothetical protein
MNHPLYPWVDPEEPAGDRPLPTTTWAARFFCVAAGWLVGYGVLFPPLARFASSAARLCLSSGIRLSILRGASGGDAWRFDSGRGARYVFLFSFFFLVGGPFSFHAKLNTVRNTAGDQKQHERERKEQERERKRQKRQREMTVRRVFYKAKKSLSLHT